MGVLRAAAKQALQYLMGLSIVLNGQKVDKPFFIVQIAAPTFSMAKSAKINRYTIWIPIVSALLIWLLGFSPIWIIIAAGIGGYLFGRLRFPKTNS